MTNKIFTVILTSSLIILVLSNRIKKMNDVPKEQVVPERNPKWNSFYTKTTPAPKATKVKPKTIFDKIKELDSCDRVHCPAILDPICALNDRNELEVFANECALGKHKLVRPLNTFYVLNKSCCLVIFQYCNQPSLDMYGTPYS